MIGVNGYLGFHQNVLDPSNPCSSTVIGKTRLLVVIRWPVLTLDHSHTVMLLRVQLPYTTLVCVCFVFVHLSQSDVPLGTGQRPIILLVCSALWWCWNLPAVACMHPRSSLCHLHRSVCYQQDLEPSTF